MSTPASFASVSRSCPSAAATISVSKGNEAKINAARADGVVAEAPVRLLVDQAEAGGLVDAPGGAQHAVGPQRELPVAGVPREAHALVHEARADAEPARLRLDQQQPQLGDGLRVLDEEHGADDLAVLLRDPAALPPRVVVLDERRHDARDQRLEALVPAVLLRVQRAVAVDEPAHVARLVGPEHVRSLLFRL